MFGVANIANIVQPLNSQITAFVNRLTDPFNFSINCVCEQDGGDHHEEVLSGQPGREARLPEGRDTGHQEEPLVPGTDAAGSRYRYDWYQVQKQSRYRYI